MEEATEDRDKEAVAIGEAATAWLSCSPDPAHQRERLLLTPSPSSSDEAFEEQPQIYVLITARRNSNKSQSSGGF